MQWVQQICHYSKFLSNNCSLWSFFDHEVITSPPFHCQPNFSLKSPCTRSEQHKSHGALIILLYWETQAWTNPLICIFFNYVVSLIKNPGPSGWEFYDGLTPQLSKDIWLWIPRRSLGRDNWWWMDLEEEYENWNMDCKKSILVRSTKSAS
jgi:hypothetical protein